MKKFLKISLITAGICMVLGLVSFSISVFVGGHKVAQIIRSSEDMDKKVSAVIDTVCTTINFATDGEWFPEYDGDIVVLGETLEKVDTSYTIPLAEVKSLDIKVGAGELELFTKKDLTDTVEIEVKGVGECTYEIEDGVLNLDGFNQLIGNSGVLGEITVYIPKNTTFEEVDIEVGAGTVELTDVNAREIDAFVGAGEMVIECMDVQMFSAKIGAGSLQTEQITTADAELEVSMGECIFEGTINGNLEAECNMGDLELYLTGKEEDHNYDIRCTAGNVTLGGMPSAGFVSDRVDNGVASTYEVSCKMGNITIEFED